MKFILKLALFLCIILGSLYFLPKSFQDHITPVFNIATSKDTYDVDNYNEFYNAIKESINSYSPSINIVFENNFLNGNRDEILKTANTLIKLLGPGNYIRKYSITYKKSLVSEVYTISYNYEKPLNVIKKQNEEVDKKALAIVDEITTPSMSDFEKEKAIHDYVVNNTQYDEENFSSGTTPIESHTAYGALINKSAVCEGYAMAMKKLFDAAKIESLIVVGSADGVDHAWNLVKLDNEWYHVDATWDDPVYMVNGKRRATILYDYFNLTDKQMEKTHKWEKQNYPKANNAKYNHK